jgi:hypothetical protein
MASCTADLRAPDGRGVWVDRPAARDLSHPECGSGTSSERAGRDGQILPWSASPPPPPPHSAPADGEVGVPQVWEALPAETKLAFGHRFSQLLVRSFRELLPHEADL